MRIAMNALGVDGGGGQTYLENLLPELDRLDQKNDYVVLLRAGHSVHLPPLSPRFRIVTLRIPRPFLFGRVLVEQFVLPGWLKRNRADLLYSPADATTFFSPCPVVLAMRNPNLYLKEDIGWTLRYKIKFAALALMARLSTKKAEQIIFVSHASLKMVTQSIQIPDRKKNVIHHGVSPFFFQKSAPVAKMEAILKDKKPYVLSVSSIYRYKNYIRLIEAFHKIRNKLPEKTHLLIVGSSFDNAYYRAMLKKIEEMGAGDHVHYIGGFPLRELPPLYRQAALFAFPSFLETFGHTLVEAMASGIPIAAADIEPTREITGGAARTFDPFDVDSMAQALDEVLTRPELRRELVEKGKKQVRNFSWSACAKSTLDVFEKAAKGH